MLQQRLNRKAVTPKLVAEFPAHLRVYDILAEGDEDLRALPVRASGGGGSKPSSRGSTTRASTSRR